MVIRLIPGRPANFEPMLATVMPYSTRYGKFASFFFGFLGIFVFDLVSGQVGVWTLVTAVSYGLLGLVAVYFFTKYPPSTRNFVTFGIAGTVLYDAVTGLSIGPLFYGQPFMEALVGQVPFTLMHVLGTVVFAVVLSPALLRFIVKNEKLETKKVFALA